MKAAIMKGYGSNSEFVIAEMAMPHIGDEDVLIEVHSSSVNPIDFKLHKAVSYLPRNGGFLKPLILGRDVSGIVKRKGSSVHDIQVGDAVYGVSMNFLTGAYAEFAAVKAKNIAPMPVNISFEEAASVPLVGLTALQGLQKGRVTKGTEILIIGASGGVGALTVQIAKSMGAKVSAVCSGGNVEFVTSLGADEVIDYTKTNYLEDGRSFDVVYDVAGCESLSSCSSLLKSDGIYISTTPNRKSIMDLFKSALLLNEKQIHFIHASSNRQDLVTLTNMIEADLLKPTVDRTFPLADINKSHYEEKNNKSKGKTVVRISE